MMAFVRGVTASRSFEGSRLPVRSSTSTSTGCAPVAITAAAVAMNVFAGITTSSPAPAPSARRTSSIAVVPEETPSARRAPECAANHCSKSATSGPEM